MPDYAAQRINAKLEQIQDRLDHDNVDDDTRDDLVQTANYLRASRIA